MDNNTETNSVGEEVRSARLSAGLSQEQVAARMRGAGIIWHQVTVGKVERGERRLGWTEGLAFTSLVGAIGSTASVSEQVTRDAAAYRRILRVIGENEAVAS